MSFLLGIDVGSSACKAAIVSPEGERIASAAVRYPTHGPEAGWKEQDPEDWYRAACEAVRSCLADASAGRAKAKAGLAKGIAATGPAHNFVLLDAHGRPVARTIHWSDTRSVSEAEALDRKSGREIFAKTFQRMSTASTLSQLLWIRKHRPDVWEQARALLVTKDYLCRRLTGRRGTDPHDAAGTQLWDVRREEWSAELCGLVGWDLSGLPEVRPAASVAGELLPDAARDLGLEPGLPVAVGSGDTAVEAFSLGAVEPGDCILKLATSANANLVTRGGKPSAVCMTYPYLDLGLWIAIASTSCGAATLKWYVDGFCADVTQAASGGDPYARIFGMAEEIEPGSAGLLFHPYLLGERSPYWDPRLTAAFHGIRDYHDRRHFVRAVMEGVAYSLRDCLEASQADNGKARRVWLIGGRARSRLWAQIVSDVLRMDLRVPEVSDAAYGSALIAGLACGEIADQGPALRKRGREETRITSDPEKSAVYQERFLQYRRLAESMTRRTR